MTKTAIPTIFCGFGSLMDIDKLIRYPRFPRRRICFGSLMDIDKLIQYAALVAFISCFGSLMDIDKLILLVLTLLYPSVLVL